MHSLRLGTTARVLLVGIATANILILSTSIQAQASLPRRGIDSAAAREMREARNRETALRSSAVPSRKSVNDPRRAQIIAERMSEDFRKLQLVRNEMVRALKAEKPLDYKSVVDKTAEVHKRASRLKAMMTPETDIVPGKDQVTRGTLGTDEMKVALIDLCNDIITFIESPAFKTPGVSNVKEAAETRRTLQHIIDLSGGIRKSAEALSKSGK